MEEKEQCERLHELIREYKLEGQLRWLVAQKDRVANGELYRYIAGARPCSIFTDKNACHRRAHQRWTACLFSLLPGKLVYNSLAALKLYHIHLFSAHRLGEGI